MKNLKALLKLDLLLLAPYKLWFLLFLGISILLGIFMSGFGDELVGFSFIISWTIFAGTIMAFPFESIDNGNMNVLYATLPTNRKSIIAGRYLIILVILVLSLVVGIIGSLALDLIFSNTITHQVMLLSISLSIGLYLLAVGFQTPFLYKVGYIKGKIFMWIPIIIVNLVMLIPTVLDLFGVENPNRFSIFNVMLSNTLPASLIALGAGAVSLIVSYILSRKIYLNKDF